MQRIGISHEMYVRRRIFNKLKAPLTFGHLKLEFSRPLGAEGNPRELLILKPKTMKKTRFTEAQIAKVLKQQEAGSKVSDL